jgi:RecB family exonuclease
LQSITEEFDRRWRQVIQPAWERRHQEVQARVEELEVFEARVAQAETLTSKSGYGVRC